MSQFRDTFTKERGNALLDYDSSASLFFGGAVLACILVPWTIRFARSYVISPEERIMKKKYPALSPAGSRYRYCSCSSCANRMDTAKSDARQWRNRVTLSSIVQLIVLLLLWVVFGKVLSVVSQAEQHIAAFDPFEILGIEKGLTDKAIKKAYRQMSLKMHPDKNPNDPTAAAKFMMITKAYNALTDEVAKRNYEKYGNPDGPGAMKVGIGLPKFLVEENHQVFVLLLFFTVLLVILPMIFIAYYTKTRKLAVSGVRVETIHFLGYYMNEMTKLRNAPEFLAASAEYRELKIRPSDDSDMQPLVKAVVEHKKRQFPNPVIVKNYFLILGHMQRRHDLMTDNLKADLDFVLKRCVQITQVMLEIAFSNNWLPTVQQVLDFRRSLIQALDIGSQTHSALLQIPYYSLTGLQRAKDAGKNRQELADFTRQSPEQRKGMERLDPQQQADAAAFCSHISDLSITATVCVDDEAEMVVGDVATITVNLTRNNLQKGEATGPVHAPHFPGTKFEEWWLFLTDKKTGQFYSYKRCRSPERVCTETLQFQLSKPGHQSVILAAMCDSYAGMDCTCDVSFKVFAEGEVKRQIVIHPEDEALDKEPTLLQQVLGKMEEESSDTESDVDENDLPASKDAAKGTESPPATG